MADRSIARAEDLPTMTNPWGEPDPHWHVNGVADMNRDGDLDLLFSYSDNPNRAYVWLLQDGQCCIDAFDVSRPGYYDPLLFYGDLDGNGSPDRIEESSIGFNLRSVSMYYRLLDGTVATKINSLPPADIGWMPSCLGDFNYDGIADIVWQDASGNIYFWLLKPVNSTEPAGLLGGGYIVPRPDPNWRLVGQLNDR